MSHLEELLARATELEVKAAELDAAGGEPASVAGVEAALQAKIDLLEERLEGSSEPGADPLADYEAGDGTDDDPAVVEALFADFDAEGFADQLDAELEEDEDDGEKGFDFDEMLDENLELKEQWVRDPIGRFAEDGKDDEGEGGKPKRKVADVKVDTLDDVRDLIARWGDLPAAMKADLKKEMAAVVAGESSDDEPHERLAALVDGLGDGDGEKEKGEGSAAAVRRGEADEWLERRKALGGDTEVKDETVTITELELLQARRAQLGA